jgi:hypothetical protein
MPLVTIPEDPINAYFTDDRGMLVAKINLLILRSVLNPPKKMLPDPDYCCGASYCDDPACNTHGMRKE